MWKICKREKSDVWKIDERREMYEREEREVRDVGKIEEKGQKNTLKREEKWKRSGKMGKQIVQIQVGEERQERKDT
jgi:hypothetical protein